MSMLRKTRIDLSVDVRQHMVELLNRHVTDLTDLFIQTKLAHWNVRGSHFIAYHELFDELAGHLNELTDTVAERVTALGGTAGLPVQGIASQTSVPAWSLETTKDLSVLEALAERWAVVANSAREAIYKSAEDDPDTSDLFTEVSRQLDKDLWFLEAHLSE
ncbi:DNA starvation/stationary phase protection protein Dps [Alicyclobacillus fastidiosus]|uniref:DNA starvation/stationary phase protection protein Dps n=1 Tax=Alicyclobacillus fastidiosus TaxID=392011 RepID=A0ABV5AC55_9BACL|nr:DNA starvation/stationary phase protection protein Dps [Alicyclobacillus fastidiosus]WEH10271.1 DNA starvation/stationary phase protection protein Dps [Alicyclobacillus fastidiosus]